jgi:hypothetical protein
MDRTLGLCPRGRAQGQADPEREARRHHGAAEGSGHRRNRRLRNETHISPPFGGDQLTIA